MNKIIAETLTEVLRGYGRTDKAALATLLDVSDWQRIARQELDHRATRVIQSMDQETLKAIATGVLDVGAICRQVADEINMTG